MGMTLLVTALMSSALGVVYSKHESRKLFVELQGLESQQDKLNVEWGRLQLEQSTWATDGRIDKAAQSRLDMIIPPADAIVVVTP